MMKLSFVMCMVFTLAACQSTPPNLETRFRAELPVDGVLTFGQ